MSWHLLVAGVAPLEGQHWMSTKASGGFGWPWIFWQFQVLFERHLLYLPGLGTWNYRCTHIQLSGCWQVCSFNSKMCCPHHISLNANSRSSARYASVPSLTVMHKFSGWLLVLLWWKFNACIHMYIYICCAAACVVESHFFCLKPYLPVCNHRIGKHRLVQKIKCKDICIVQ